MSDDLNPGSENDESNSPKALRDALRKANDELAALRKEREDAAAEKRKSTLEEIFKAKSLKPSAASHYSGEASEDAVVQWATEIGLLATEETKDANAEAAARAAAVSGGSASPQPSSPSNGGPIVGDPQKILELMSNPAFTYEDGVRLGIFPEDPNVI